MNPSQGAGAAHLEYLHACGPICARLEGRIQLHPCMEWARIDCVGHTKTQFTVDFQHPSFHRICCFYSSAKPSHVLAGRRGAKQHAAQADTEHASATNESAVRSWDI